MNGLIRETRHWVVLLLLSALALGALKQAGAGGIGFKEAAMVVGVSVAVIWNLKRAVRRLQPRSRREPPARPELSGRSQWIGPRTQDTERRG